jgi:translation initiation factor IF-3
MNFDHKRYSVNFQIRANTVRLSHDNNQLGIMPVDKARQYAQNQGLDLIETVPGANPPVCIVDNFSKFKYENKLREKETRKKQKKTMVILKEIRLTPTITDHDLETKAKMAVRFLQEEKKVLISMKFTPRELNHKDIGFQTFEKLFEITKEYGQLDGTLKFAGKKLCCTISPAGQRHESKQN